MFKKFRSVLKKNPLVLTFTVLMGLAGCKPSIDHITITYQNQDVETYYFDSSPAETQLVEIDSGEQIVIDVKTSDSRSTHVPNHKLSWNVRGEFVSDWIINGAEEWDDRNRLTFNGNKITFKGPQDFTREIIVEVTVICIEAPDSPIIIEFTLKSVAVDRLEQLNKVMLETADSISNKMSTEYQSVEVKNNKKHFQQMHALQAVTEEHFNKEETTIEDVQKKLNHAKKLLTYLEENNQFVSQVSASISSTDYVEKCLKNINEKHDFHTDQTELLYSQKLCLNNVSDVSHRSGRRRNRATEFISPQSALPASAGLAATECWNYEFTLAMLPEPSSKVAAAGLTPLCFAIAAVGPAIYYLNSSKEDESDKDDYPYIYRQKYITHIYYSPVLSYKIKNNSDHAYDMRPLDNILKHKCGNKQLLCVVELTDSDKEELEIFKQTLDLYAEYASHNVFKEEKLSYIQSANDENRRLNDNEYRVSLSSGMLKLENNKFETINWSEKIADNYYLESKRNFNKGFLVRVPLNDNQKEIFQYIKKKATIAVKGGNADSQIIKIKSGFINCGGKKLIKPNCALNFTFGPDSIFSEAFLKQSEKKLFGNNMDENLVMLKTSSLADNSKSAAAYCRIGLDTQKLSEAEMILSQGQDKQVGCFTVTVDNTNNFTLRLMQNVRRYYIDCNLDNETVEVIQGRSCYGLNEKTRITVFLVFDKNNFTTDYSDLFSGNQSIVEFNELLPYGSQGGSNGSFKVHGYSGMFEASNIEAVFMNPLNALENASMRKMFKNALNFQRSDIMFWDTRNIRNMSNMFHGAENFNLHINHWNVGNVTNMSSMFYGASLFHQGLPEWDVSGVEFMQNMFRNATQFNGVINSWDVTSVTNMDFMFNGATNFSQNLSKWLVSEDIDFNENYRNNMFQGSGLQGRPALHPKEESELLLAD